MSITRFLVIKSAAIPLICYLPFYLALAKCVHARASCDQATAA